MRCAAPHFYCHAEGKINVHYDFGAAKGADRI